MVVFWILATLMTAVALAFVLVPLLRARADAGPSVMDANLDVLRGQRREIEADVADGTLPADAKDEALAELVRRARADLTTAPGPVRTPNKPWITVALVAVAIPLVAFGVYLANGTPAAADPKLGLRDADGPVDDKKILAMVENLARKVRERPDDVQGWALLARSMAALGRFQESADAYARLDKLKPDDPGVLADYADALGMAQGRTLAGKPYELAKRALALDPTQKKALALAGSAALDAGDFDNGVRYWQALGKQLPADSEDAVQVRAIVADAMLKSAAAGEVFGKAPRAAAQAPAPVAITTAAKSVSGSVGIAPALAERVGKADTLFIFARAENGPRMPLAIVRASAQPLPTTFTLDDTQAMSPATRLSSAQAVRIEARISRSGNAAPQPGDLVGSSGVVKPGARDVRIVIDKVLP
jgi:cytochrome c-type biogenesis protein CcmH